MNYRAVLQQPLWLSLFVITTLCHVSVAAAIKWCPTHQGSCSPFVKRTLRCCGKVPTGLQVAYQRFITKPARKQWGTYPILHRTLSICVSRDNWEGSDRFFQHCNNRATVRPRASSLVTRDTYRTSASVSSPRNHNTHLDEVRN